MYRINAAGRHPMLLWAVKEPQGGCAECVVYEPRGQHGVETTNAAVAMRALVDNSVTSMQTKYAERAKVIEGNFRDARDRAAAIEEVRTAFMEVAAQDHDTAPGLRDLWPRIEEHVNSGHDFNPSVLDADAAMQQIHSMKNYLTTKHAAATTQADDLYEVSTSINMTLVHTHSDTELRARERELQQLALRMLVTAGEGAALTRRRGVEVIDTPATTVALVARHVKRDAPVNDTPAREWLRARRNAEGGSVQETLKMAEQCPELYSLCFPYKQDEWIGVDPLEKVGSNTDVVKAEGYRAPAVVASVVLPSMLVGIEERAITLDMIEDVSRMLTSHDPFKGRSPAQEMFARYGHRHAAPSAYKASRAVGAIAALVGDDWDTAMTRSDARHARDAVEKAREETGEEGATDPAALQMYVAAQGEWPKETAEYFRLAPTDITANTHDAIIEFDTAGAWSAGHGPSDVCDAIEGVQAYLRAKIGSP